MISTPFLFLPFHTLDLRSATPRPIDCAMSRSTSRRPPRRSEDAWNDQKVLACHIAGCGVYCSVSERLKICVRICICRWVWVWVWVWDHQHDNMISLATRRQTEQRLALALALVGDVGLTALTPDSNFGRFWVPQGFTPWSSPLTFLGSFSASHLLHL